MKLIDNVIVFQDVPDNYWAAEAIAFTASRELFLGTEVGMFAPGVSMSRAMLFTVLARLDGVETEGGESWYSKARDWAMAAGISDGSAPEAAITREQLIALLYRSPDSLQRTAAARALRIAAKFPHGQEKPWIGRWRRAS
ncbi:S-layer homology domain-containing protein [Paenibacillus sp. PAMC21692]|uniref:S-layer homology domain-containing protein n=1 Tax=Paenibacillus sp. PAMC21692 TaxID=2762320 RepID=UPI0021C44EB9|nr:S-layer homology domain-containing protein [Paenibacillus sp. PAMC21692]